MATEQDMNTQASVFAAALTLYMERDKVHNGLWAQDDPTELAGQALHKAKRVDFHCRPGQENTKQAVEDALDMINYAAFTIRRLGASFVMIEDDHPAVMD